MKKVSAVIYIFLLSFVIGLSYSTWVYNYKIETDASFDFKKVGGKIDNYLDSATTPYASFTSLEGAIRSAETYPNQTVKMYLTTGSFIDVSNQNITLKSWMQLYMPYEGRTCDISSDSEVSSLKNTFIDTTTALIKQYNVSGFNFYNSTLTIESGSSVTIGGQYQECGVGNYYSQISLDNNSSITVSGTLTCNGYIKEINNNNIDQESNINYLNADQIDNSSDVNRYINVLSGGTIFIPLALYDAGGSMGVLTGLNDAGVFPINTFDFPNVQTFLKVNAGATFNSKARLIRKSGTTTVPINQPVTVIKPSSSSVSSLMTLNSGYVSFEYCPLNPGFTKKDASKTYLTINGDVSLGYLSLQVTVSSVTQTISTADVFLPFSYKFRIYIATNGIFNTNSYDIKFLPGSLLKILKGGLFSLSSNLIAYKSSSLSGISTSYPTHYDDATIIVCGTFRANNGSNVGAHFKTLSSDASAALDFTSVNQNSLNASSPESMSSTMIKIYSSGDFFDETTGSITSLLVKAGVVINSNYNSNNQYFWERNGGIKSYTLSIVVNNINNYEYPLVGYQVYKYDANDNETILTTEGVYETINKEFILAEEESYKIISLDRAESTVFTKQSGSNYSFTSGQKYLIQGDTEVSIYPGEGILIRCSVSNASGAGGATHKIYEKTNGSYYQIASFNGPTTSLDVAVKKGATIKYWVKLGTQNVIDYSTGDHYKFSGIVNKTSATSTNDVADGTRLTTNSENSGKYSEVSNIQDSCTIHQLITKGGCLLPTSRILMSDGSYKLAGDVKLGDIVMSFDHEEGYLKPTPIIINDDIDKEADYYNVIHLVFENGNETDFVYEHGFFDRTFNKYVYLTEANSKEYIGHEFVYFKDKDSNFELTKLVGVQIDTKFVQVCSPATANSLNIVSDNMLSIAGGLTGLFNIFEYDNETLKFDEKLMQLDIEKYGLLSYDYFKNYFPQEVYNLLPCKYMAISIEKGLITWEIIEQYVEHWGDQLLDNID